MRILSVLLLLPILYSCRDVHERKVINCDGLKIHWYYVNYFSSQRAFIDAHKSNQKINILDSENSQITDIYCSGDTIFIKVYDYHNFPIYALKNKAFDRFVRIDSSATRNEALRIYQPSFYKPEKKE